MGKRGQERDGNKGILTDEEIEKKVILPKGKQVFGVVESRLGYGRMNVICSDKKIRVCRVPGRYARRIWIREGDVVIVEPWSIQGDKKGDIIHKYRPVEIDWLRRKGFLKGLEEFII